MASILRKPGSPVKSSVQICPPQGAHSNRQPYFDALDAADEALRATHVVDVSKMEELLESLLATQLTKAFEQAGGHVTARDV
jgi:hypothetical protein